MEIAIVESLCYDRASTHISRPLTLKHDIESLFHMKQVDGSTVHKLHIGDIASSYYSTL